MNVRSLKPPSMIRPVSELYTNFISNVFTPSSSGAFVIGNQQRIFHKALSSLPKYQFRGAQFASWLYRIAANAIVDYAKTAGREISGLEQHCEGDPPPDLEHIEHRARLFRLVDDLPGEQRLVVFARFVADKSIREVAQGLGKTEGAIEQLQFRALTTLRKQMEGAHA